MTGDGTRHRGFLDALPEAATVVEVSPRDGLQSLSRWITTDGKVRMIDRLSAAGFPVIEVSSFAHPRVVPNLCDAEEVFARIRREPGVVYRALVPNARGVERAVAAGVDAVAGLVTVSEAYTLRNQNTTVSGALEELARAHEAAEGAGIDFTAGVGMAFFGPYEGRIPEERVLDVVERVHTLGIQDVYLAGSLGMEDPRHVHDLFRRLSTEWPDLQLGYHVHDLAGFGSANVLAALTGGATSVEGSICGVGGGIAMPSEFPSVGNLPTEDIVHLLHVLGVNTGLDVSEVLAAARDVARTLAISPRSRLTATGSRDDLVAAATAFA